MQQNDLQFIDSHAHLTMEVFDNTREEVIQRAKDHGLCHIVNICCDKLALEKGLLLQKRHPQIALAAAISPHDAEKQKDQDWAYFEKIAKTKKLAAIGETGLDYYYFPSSKEKQKALFINYITLAKECHLPLIIHCRDAFDDLFAILDTFSLNIPTILHCFTGSQQNANEALKRRFWISFSGIITFKNSFSLQDVVKNIPINRLLIETDSPYLAPQKYRGKCNEPSYVIEVAKKIAEIKNLSLEEVAAATSSNAKNIFFKRTII